MADTPFIAVVPARFASSRLPAKPLADIAGKPMVVRVAERARASNASQVWVACDHAEIMAACQQHGIDALMTRTDHESGTTRLAEVAEQLTLTDDTVIVNVQGDEPLIDPALIDRTADVLCNAPEASIATACHPITDAQRFFSPHVVKVVCDAQGFAQYFSRAPIPYARDHFAKDQTTLPAGFIARQHVGIYAYRRDFLRRYASLPPAPTESVESLEQLRAMHHGFRIIVHVWHGTVAPGVDTPDDLEAVRALFNK